MLKDQIKCIANFFVTPLAVLIVLASISIALAGLYDILLSQASSYLPGAMDYASPLDTWVSPVIALPAGVAVAFFLLSVSD